MDKIKEKIRKLLALAAGTNNENEADAALSQARRLMAQHEIDDGDLGVEGGVPPSPEQLVGSTSMPVPGRRPRWDESLVTAVCMFYGVKALIRKVFERRGGTHWGKTQTLIWYGHKAWAAEAAASHSALVAQVVSMGNAYRPRVRAPGGRPLYEHERGAITRSARLEYREGLADGLMFRVYRMKAQEELGTHGPEVQALAKRHEDLADIWIDQEDVKLHKAPKQRPIDGTGSMAHWRAGRDDSDKLHVGRSLAASATGIVRR